MCFPLQGALRTGRKYGRARNKDGPEFLAQKYEWLVHFFYFTQKILARPKKHQKGVARPILARPLLQKKMFFGPS